MGEPSHTAMVATMLPLLRRADFEPSGEKTSSSSCSVDSSLDAEPSHADCLHGTVGEARGVKALKHTFVTLPNDTILFLLNGYPPQLDSGLAGLRGLPGLLELLGLEALSLRHTRVDASDANGDFKYSWSTTTTAAAAAAVAEAAAAAALHSKLPCAATSAARDNEDNPVDIECFAFVTMTACSSHK